MYRLNGPHRAQNMKVVFNTVIDVWAIKLLAHITVWNVIDV